MNCVDCNRLLGAYLDGELDTRGALSIDEHLQACANCRRGCERLQATSAALGRHCAAPAAPASLQAMVQEQMAAAAPSGRQRWLLASLVAAVPGLLALALAGWLALQPRPASLVANTANAGTRVVYHVSASDHATAVLRNVANHLAAEPHVQIVVVAHNAGVDFLLRGAKDDSGQGFDAAVEAFAARGVQFRVCRNTLDRRRIPATAVLREASLVPSGIAEISRLQSREGYVYMRF